MHHGFTLIEVLIVVTIISLLAALLVPTVATFQRMAVRSRTQSQLADVSLAVRMYQQDRSAYPICSGNFTVGNWTWAEANARMLYTELVGRDVDHRGNPRPGYLSGHFKGTLVAGGMINDPYGRPLIYYGRNYAGTWTGSTAGAVPFQGNFAGFELWSAGPDKAFSDLRARPGVADDVDSDNIPARTYDPGTQR